MDELYLAYLELRASGMELDHTCDEPACRNPAHLEPKTHRENLADGRERWALRKAALVDQPPSEEEDVELEF